MPTVEIYFKDYCPYCHKAKALFDQKGVDYTLYEVTHDPDKQNEMRKRNPQARTVPQIFINDQSIGGCDDLYVLDRQGKLDPLLGL